MKKGDIILIPFPFTDLQGTKTRPALVLISSELDITVSFISTQLKWIDEFDVVLKPDKTNGLKKKSLVRLSKLATIDKELALGKLGNLKQSELKSVDKNLLKLFQIY